LRAFKRDIFEVYVLREVIDAIVSHCESYAPLEAMGILLGDSFLWKGFEYTLVEKHIPCLSESTTASVKLSDAGIKNLIKIIHEVKKSTPEILIVGWYHSHPGYGCFLSSVDIETQRRFFSESFHIAIVVDPLKKELGFYKLTINGYRAVSPCFLKKCCEKGEKIESKKDKNKKYQI
jgi:26S proteasome regulatory subunit N11